MLMLLLSICDKIYISPFVVRQDVDEKQKEEHRKKLVAASAFADHARPMLFLI